MQVQVLSPSYDGYASEDWLLEESDLFCRARKNPDITHVYHRLYEAMIDRWPSILTGVLITDFDTRELGELAGKASDKTVTNFIADLKEIGAVSYYKAGGELDSKGQYSKGKIQGNPDIMPYPETFKLRQTSQRNKERESQRNRNAQRTLILQCFNCGSANLRHDLHTVCKDCNWKHTPLLDIPPSSINLNADKPECTTEDGFFPESEPMHKHPNPVTPLPPVQDTGPMDIVASPEASMRRAELAEREAATRQALQQQTDAYKVTEKDLPDWLRPGTWSYKKLVERVGQKEVDTRRKVALEGKL